MVIGDGIDEEARAFGLFGGKAGSINEMEFIFPGNRRYKPQSKELVPDIQKGTVLRQVAGGGGGYCDTFQRSGEKVAKEVRNGTLSVQKAREDYEVLLESETLKVATGATEKLRSLYQE